MKNNWHDDVFLGLHFDIHAAIDDVELGKYLTKEHLIKQFNKIKPDFVQCDCKGHPGVASYPTKVGLKSTGIEKDALRIWRDATKELGIPLVMHFSGVFDTAAITAKPSWARISQTGEASKDNTCPLSDYTKDYMIPQLVEIITEYDVDGFWVDGENWASEPCYCNRCKTEFKEVTGLTEVPTDKTMDNWKEWLEFSRQNFVEHVSLYSEAIHKVKPSCTSCSNWMYTVRQPDDIVAPVDYLSGDFAWIWSCSNAMMEARFLDSRELKWDLMAWGFTSYGPMESWVFKSVEAICQEAAVVMSCGGAFTIYDTPNRWGTLVEWHMDDLADVAKFCRARQPHCQDTKSVPQVALLHNADHFYANSTPLFNFGNAANPIEGALHIISENNLHTDIVSNYKLIKTINSYPLCVVPEQTKLSEEMVTKLKEYVKQGGNLIVSGVETAKYFKDILGVEIKDGIAKGYNNIQNVSIEVGKRTVPVIGEWGKVVIATPTPSPSGAKVSKAKAIKYLLGSRDGGANKKATSYLASSINSYGEGKIVGIYGNIFGNYYKSHYYLMREFFGNIVKTIDSEKLVRVEAPARLSVTIREKEEKLMINFINLGCDHPTTPTATMVESVPDIHNITVEMKLESIPKSVILEPGSRGVEWQYNNMSLVAKIRSVSIHDILVIEK